MKYMQFQFEKELKKILADAKANKQTRLCVVSKELHDRVVTAGDKRMPMACNAMWALWRQQGHRQTAIINTTDSEKSSTIKIEFNTF